jgi:hypothetical protein
MLLLLVLLQGFLTPEHFTAKTALSLSTGAKIDLLLGTGQLIKNRALRLWSHQASVTDGCIKE